MSLVR
jgi:hypothetical protein